MNDTPKRILIDSGIVYTNYGFSNQRELGETKGGSIFEVEVEFRQVEADGQKGRTKGMKRKIREDAAITANILNLSMENLKLALPGAIITSNKLKSGWKVEMSEYLNNVTIIGETLEGKLVKLTVYNAMTEDGLNIPLVDKEESAVSLKFWAHHVSGEDLWDIEEIDSISDNPLDPVDPGTVDFSSLQSEVNWVNSSFFEHEYTPESWMFLQDALVSANNVLNNPYATQNDVDSALFNLNSATNQLVSNSSEEVDKSLLLDKIAYLAGLPSEQYTTDSWNQLQLSLDAANSIYHDETATQLDVDTALNNLIVDEGNLVLI